MSVAREHDRHHQHLPVSERLIEPFQRPLPGAPWRNAIHVLESAAIIGPVSSVQFQLRPECAKSELAAQLSQPGLGLRRGDQLKAGPYRFGDAGSNRTLRFLQQLMGYFHCNFARRLHKASVSIVP